MEGASTTHGIVMRTSCLNGEDVKKKDAASPSAHDMPVTCGSVDLVGISLEQKHCLSVKIS